MPIEIAEVLQLAEEHAERSGITNERYLVGLATLNAHQNHDDRAIEWCDRAEASIKEFAESTPLSEGTKKDAEFARHLREAIQSGRGKGFLAMASDQ